LKNGGGEAEAKSAKSGVKNSLAKALLLCIIGFMAGKHTFCSPHKAVLCLNTLLLRRKAQ